MAAAEGCVPLGWLSGVWVLSGQCLQKQAPVVFVYLFGGDGPVGDFTKQAIHFIVRLSMISKGFRLFLKHVAKQRLRLRQSRCNKLGMRGSAHRRIGRPPPDPCAKAVKRRTSCPALTPRATAALLATAKIDVFPSKVETSTAAAASSCSRTRSPRVRRASGFVLSSVAVKNRTPEMSLAKEKRFWISASAIFETSGQVGGLFLSVLRPVPPHAPAHPHRNRPLMHRPSR